MWAAQRCLRRPKTHVGYSVAHNYRNISDVKHETDEYGIPLKPTWSVHKLLSSYPKPTLSSAALTRLHELSALVAPEEGTPERDKLKGEMEELIKLVEAVKLVDTHGIQPTLSKISDQQSSSKEDDPSGRTLLRNAARTADGLYVVDSDRKKL